MTFFQQRPWGHSSSEDHVLVQGGSCAGKELASATIHALSSRAGRAFVARNAATFPEGLVDAELFGTAKGYPNARTPERPGLIAEADGGMLFISTAASTAGIAEPR